MRLTEIVAAGLVLLILVGGPGMAALDLEWGRSALVPEEPDLCSLHDLLMESGVDHARAEGVLLHASSEHQHHPAARALDGFLATAWVAAEMPAFLVVDLGQTRRINAIYWACSAASRAPQQYLVESSSDGEHWTLLAEGRGFTGPNCVHYFPATAARHVRLRVERAQGGGTAVIGELRILELPETSPAEWLRPDREYRWRLRLGEHAADLRAPGIVSLELDPGQARNAAQWLDNSTMVVLDPALPEADQQLASFWMTDDRYDGQTETRGRLLVFTPHQPAADTVWELYYDLPESPALTPPPLALDPVLRQHPGQQRMTVTLREAAGTPQVLAWDDLRRPLEPRMLAPLRGVLEPVSCHRAYCVAYRTAPGPWRAAWLRPQALQPGALGFDLARSTYLYGERMQVRLTPDPPLTGPEAESRLRLWLEHARTGEAFHRRDLPLGAEQSVSTLMDPLWLRPGAYRLCAEVLSGEEIVRAGHFGVFVAPPPVRQPLYQMWGMPHASRGEVDTWLSRLEAMNFNNVSVKTWRPLEYLLDQAPRRGVTVMIDSVLQAHLPAEGEKRALASSGDPVEHPQGRESLIHPEVRAAAQQRLVEDIRRYRDFPGFSGYFEYFDDRLIHHGSPLEGSDRHNLADYSAYTCEVFRQEHGYDPPRVEDLQVPPPGTVLPDDDPWLTWMTFRADDYYAGFMRSLQQARDLVAPEVKLSPVHGIGDCYFRPALGISVPWNMGASDYTRSYHYTSGWPRWRRPNTDYFFQTETGRLGNRGQENFLLAGSIGGDELAPHWHLTNQIASLLAAGQHHVALAHFTPWYNPTVTVWDDPAVREALARGGEKVRRLAPLLQAREFAPSEVALLVSFSTSAYTAGLNEHPDQAPHRPAMQRAFNALLLAGLPAELIDETELLAGRARQYRALVLTQVDYLTRSAYEALAQFVREGGILLADAGTDLQIPGMERYGGFEELARRLRPALTTHFRSSVPELVTRRFSVGDTDYLFVLNLATELVHFGYEYAELWELNFPELGVTVTEGPGEPRQVSGVIRVQRPQPIGAAYDLETGQRLPLRHTGAGWEIPVTVAPADVTVIALHPHPLGNVSLQAPTRGGPGDSLAVVARVSDQAGRPFHGAELVQLDVLDPAGRTDPRFTQPAVVKGGEARWEFRLADDELCGKWQVRLRSRGSGLAAQRTIQVR